jgi:hypothetical protein
MWGVCGVLALLGLASYRLILVTFEAFDHPFDWRHWSLLVVNMMFMAYAEGYRGFQKNYSPRVAARAKCLLKAPTLFAAILAPVFCMSYFHTTRRRLISTYVLTAAIIALIVLFQYLSQPWRGILDAGVVVGLTWGMVSIVPFALRAFFDGTFDYSPELPSQC